MEQFIGLDVSMKETHICVVDGTGEVTSRGRTATDPDALAAQIGRLAPEARVVLLETGGQSSWLKRELVAREVPAVIADARRAKAALSCRMNKTDANDAEGLAQLARTGWYREVAAKHPETRGSRSLLLARRLLVKQQRAVENQVRGLLRGFGLPVGKVAKGSFQHRARTLASQAPALMCAIDALLEARSTFLRQIKGLDSAIRKATRKSDTCRRLMTVPGVGDMTALAYVTAIDDPHRFARSSSVGAYLGLTPRRYQSGEVDFAGRVSKQGDGLARAMLYEAANALLTKTRRWSAPKAWGVRMAGQNGGKKTRVALARKLAVILHRIWVDGTTFRWSDEPVPADGGGVRLRKKRMAKA